MTNVQSVNGRALKPASYIQRMLVFALHRALEATTPERTDFWYAQVQRLERLERIQQTGPVSLSVH